MELTDRPGYAPRVPRQRLFGLDPAGVHRPGGAGADGLYPQMWSTGSSDFGDVTTVMPGVQFYAAGAVGSPHGDDYLPADPVRLCVNSAKAQVLLADAAAEKLPPPGTS